MTDNIKYELSAPVTGKCIPVSQADNSELRNKTIGDGVAIYPNSGAIHAPCDGRVLDISPANNVITLSSEDGLELVLQLGIATEELGGQGYRILVQKGHRVRRGQKIATMNIDMLESEGFDITVALLISSMQKINTVKAIRGDVNGSNDIVLKYSKA